MQVHSDGKVRRSREEWEAIFSRFERSGLSEAAFCREEKIAKSSFSKRKRDLGAGIPVPAFVEFEAAPAPREAAPAALAAGEVVLTLPGGASLRWKA